MEDIEFLKEKKLKYMEKYYEKYNPFGKSNSSKIKEIDTKHKTSYKYPNIFMYYKKMPSKDKYIIVCLYIILLAMFIIGLFYTKEYTDNKINLILYMTIVGLVYLSYNIVNVVLTLRDINSKDLNKQDYNYFDGENLYTYYVYQWITVKNKVRKYTKIDYSSISKIIYKDNQTEEEVNYIENIKSKYPTVYYMASKLFNASEITPEVLRFKKLYFKLESNVYNLKYENNPKNKLFKILISNYANVDMLSEFKVVLKDNDTKNSLYKKNHDSLIYNTILEHTDKLNNFKYTELYSSDYLLELKKFSKLNVSYVNQCLCLPMNFEMILTMLRLSDTIDSVLIYKKYSYFFEVLNTVIQEYLDNVDDVSYLTKLNNSKVVTELDTFLKSFVSDLNNLNTIYKHNLSLKIKATEDLSRNGNRLNLDNLAEELSNQNKIITYD